jgi:hypothetical protein
MLHDLTQDSEVVALTSEVARLEPIAKSIKIRTPEQYTEAAEHLKRCKGALKQIEDARVRITKPINESLREVNNQARESAKPWLAAETMIKAEMVVWQNDQLRLQREEQQKRDEAAAKERKRLADQAAKALADGKVEKAAKIEERAASVVAPVVTREIPKISGQSTRETWLFELQDLAKVPREFLMLDETKVRKYVQAMKDTGSIDGIRIYSEKRIASGAA